jgi:hypothetical protein
MVTTSTLSLLGWTDVLEDEADERVRLEEFEHDCRLAEVIWRHRCVVFLCLISSGIPHNCATNNVSIFVRPMIYQGPREAKCSEFRDPAGGLKFLLCNFLLSLEELIEAAIRPLQESSAQFSFWTDVCFKSLSSEKKWSWPSR